MLRKITLIIGIVIATLVLGIGIYHSDASQKDSVLSEEEITSLVQSQYPGKIESIQMDDQSKQPVYTVVIVNDGVEYELKVDANDGEIKQLKETRTLVLKEQNDEKAEKGVEGEDTGKPTDQGEEANEETVNPKTSIKKDETKRKDQNTKEQEEKTTKADNKSAPSAKETVITKEEAIEIALNEFSGEVDDVDLEEEDGRLIYEIEIEREDLEAEIEIDAYTGEIIVIEIDD